MNLVDASGISPMYVAALKGYKEIVKEFVIAGGNAVEAVSHAKTQGETSVISVIRNVVKEGKKRGISRVIW